jgi:hypothetical protein
MLLRWPYSIDFREIVFREAEKKFKMGIIGYSSEMFMKLEPIPSDGQTAHVTN